MKRGPLAIVCAFLCALPAWPILMIFEPEKRAPNMSCPAVIDAWERIVDWLRWFHDLKNLGTELFRCDAQWWFKWTGFVVTTESLYAVAVSILALVLWVKLRRARQWRKGR